MLKFIPNILNPAFWKKTIKEMKLIWLLMRDSQVPRYWKILPLLVVAYFIFPIDLIPGFIPILGQLDDLTVLLLALNILPKVAPNEIVASYRQELKAAS